jgi:(E)-4-hydroxy-3-methylbut-2-enyl-diphosphate synthase
MTSLRLSQGEWRAPGTGETPTAPVFIDGKKAATLRGATLSADFKQMVIDYIENRWGAGARTAAE